MFSCKTNEYTLRVSKEITSPSIVLDSVCKHLIEQNNYTFIIKNVVWNNMCNCGLIDISSSHSHWYDYYPILISSDGSATIIVDFKRKYHENLSVIESNIDSLFHHFKGNHLDYFSDNEFLFMEKRLKKKIIHFGSSAATSNLDLERDSSLLDIYLNTNDTIIKRPVTRK
jgi:hypothetical protein